MNKSGAVAVIGAGLMGHALALVHAIGGCRVKMQDISIKQLESGMELITNALDTLIAASSLEGNKRATIISRIDPVEKLEDAVSEADLIVEAVSETVEVKEKVFRDIDAAASLNSIIASNTSGLDIFPLVPSRRLKTTIIAHWYTPPYIIDLVDLAAGLETDPEVLARMEKFYLGMKKKPVVFEKFISGYVANRLQAAMGLEMMKLLDEGWATARAIDDSIKYGLAHRMALQGALMKADFAGLKLWQQGSKNQTYQPPVQTGGSPTVDRLVEEGRYGVMSGAGFFDYGGKTPAQIFKNRDMGLLRLKAQAAEIEEEYPLGS
ncbi:MAG TPA: 3-hydroxyacyl-CoA dehydrogenase [Dehalococcoidia bacterium]|nr:3-hydroxyacyl-CoA dehydrogenase [Dehalococcoidia bacterium]|tara:strand:+ start:564 stop:1526 length:963 start_codon:yes stop_codon:yes gene_type:complete